MRRHGHAQRDETGRITSLTYRTWQSMRTRCFNPQSDQYNSYGGKGITVCERWLVFENFLADMGERPSVSHTIDRFPNKNGNYGPGNCRWATPSEQQNNTNKNRIIEAQGQTRTLSEWSRLTGIGISTLFNRLERGWPDEAVVTKPPGKRGPRFIVLNGVEQNVTEWARANGLPVSTLFHRLSAGWAITDALSRPAKRTGRPRRTC